MNLSIELDPPTVIVFYDGDCGFCNRTVTWLLKNRKQAIYFCALQSEYAQKIMKEHTITINMDTLYVKINDKVYHRYRAVHKLSKHLKPPYSLLHPLGFLLPISIGNFFYNQIAKRRHKIAPKNCSLPTPEEKKIFIC